MIDSTTGRRAVLIGASLGVAGASAQPAGGSSAIMSARANAGTVGIVSGGIDGTYIRIATDLASVLDDGDRLRILPIVGKGSVQNLADIVYLRGVDLGIVQSDVYAFVLRQNLLPGVGQAITYLAKLYDEEVHILSRAGIERLEDLANQPVNVDVRGSGTAMTAALIFERLGIPVRTVNDGQDIALQRLRAGEIAAMLYVTGKPARLFASLPAGAGLHFLPIPPAAELLQTYLPAQLSHETYPELVPEGRPVETLAVGAVLASYGWAPGTERHAKVARFAAALTARFDQFQRPPRHPKWREVSLGAQVPGWTRLNLAEAPPRPRGWQR